MERFIATCSKSCPFRLLSAQLVFCFNSRRVKTRGSFKIGKIKMLQKQKLVSCEQHWETHKGVTFFWSLIEFFLLAGKTQSQICFRLKLGKCTLGGNTPLTSDPLALCFSSLKDFKRFQNDTYLYSTHGRIYLWIANRQNGVLVYVSIRADIASDTAVHPHLARLRISGLDGRENFSPPTRMPMSRTHLDGWKIPGIQWHLARIGNLIVCIFHFNPNYETSLPWHFIFCSALLSHPHVIPRNWEPVIRVVLSV